MSTYDAQTAYTDTKTFITHAQSQADAAIDRLTDQATKWTIAALSAVTNLTLPTVNTAAGTKPALTTLTLPTFSAADFSGLTSPVLPTPVSLAGGTSPLWSETFWTNLKTKLSAFTDSITGADDVDAVVTKLTSDTTKIQVALYAKDYERKSQVLRDAYSAAEASIGAKGFSYPNSMVTALKMDAQQKFQFDLSQTARDLIIQVFGWARESYQFALQQSLAAHNADVDFNVRYLDTTVKVYAETVNALVAKYREDITAAIQKATIKVQEFATQFDHELAKQQSLKEIQLKDAAFDVDVAKTNAGIVLETMKTQIEDFKARVANFLETARVNLDDRDRNIKNQISAASAAAQAATALSATASTITLNASGA